MVEIYRHYVPGKLLLLAGLEALILFCAVQVGFALQFAEFQDAIQAIASSGIELATQAGMFAVIMLLIMASMGLYQLDLWNDTHSAKVRLLSAFVLGFATVSLLSYLVPSFYLGHAALISAPIALGLAGTLGVRAAFRKWSNQGAFKSRVLVLGTGSRVVPLAEHGERHPNHQVIGFVSLQPAKAYVPASKVLAVNPGETLASIAQRHAADQIVVAVRDRRNGGLPVQQLLECKTKGYKVVELSTFFEREYRQVMLDSLNPSWMVLGEGFRQGALRDAVKRLFDVTVSLALLVICAPVLLLSALAIALESGRPVLYRQERAGRDNRVFTLYKLRSMRHDAEQPGEPRWAAADDDRTTRVGRLIRKMRIDELPQIINVLRGEMSFVGPRPERLHFVEQLEKQIPYYALRHSVKPGITGWAQVRYSYGASVDDAVEKLQHDLYYVKNHSLFLDIMILIATVEVVLWGRGAR